MIKGHKMSSTHKHSFLKYGFELLIPHRFRINVRSKYHNSARLESGKLCDCLQVYSVVVLKAIEGNKFKNEFGCENVVLSLIYTRSGQPAVSRDVHVHVQTTFLKKVRFHVHNQFACQELCSTIMVEFMEQTSFVRVQPFFRWRIFF